MSINNNYMAKIAMSKSILKEFQNNSNERVTYLNDGNEFQIQLFNPETFTIGAEISINGNTLPGIIVIKPGERHWIERPTNSNKKFKFETYEVEDSAEVANAIAKNGVVTVKFYKEKIVNNVSYTNYHPIFYYNSDVNYEYSGPTVLCNSNTYCDRGVRSKSISNSNSNNNAKCFSKSIVNSVDSLGFSADNIQLCSAMIDNGDNMLSFEAPTPEIATMETGRISEGSRSDQEFKHVNIEFEYWAYKTETIKILPMSRKPFTSSDLQKVYCVNCGRKLNPKYKFCPYCGAKCDQFFEDDEA